MTVRPKRDFLSTKDLKRDEVENLLELAERMKRKGAGQSLLPGKTLGLLFFSRSLRTRVSFEVAMEQLGGKCIVVSAQQDIYELEPDEKAVMDGRAEEHVKDAARTLSRYLDALAVRHLGFGRDFAQDQQEPVLMGYARNATVPVINMESPMQHPCQAIADIMTMRERAVRLEGRKLSIVWTNHPQSRSLAVPHSLLLLAATMGMDVRLVHPLGYELDPAVMQAAQRNAELGGGAVRVVNQPEQGVDHADFVYARSWGSLKYYGDAEREALVKRSLQHWMVTQELMARTQNGWFMHPLPVRRNVDVTDEVMDGERSAVYDQAENRLHTQKAILVNLLK
jgi:N-acetylornithine carbamoyltransferase